MASLFLSDNGDLLRRHPRGHNPEHCRGRSPVGGPPADVLETPTFYTFLLDVPGLSKSDLQVTVEDNRALVISSSGKRKREEEENCRYLRQERRAAGKIARKFRLPEDADARAATARCEDGVLTVAVPRRPLRGKKATTVEVAVA